MTVHSAFMLERYLSKFGCSLTHTVLYNNSFCFVFSDVNDIQACLIKKYDQSSNRVQVMPLNADEVMPIQDIYGDLELAEEPTNMRKTRKEDEVTGKNLLNSIADMFHVNKKLKRIFVKGEAGHGKSVLCLKLSKVWANEKRVKDSAKSNKSDQAENLNTEQKNQMSHADNLEDDAKLSHCLSVYELVFHVSLCHARSLSERSSLMDLVCDNFPECDQNNKGKIKQILADSNIPCLIILDGLDEYKLPSVSRVKGFLEYGLVNTVVLCTMRPWRMVDLELGLESDHDKVVQICGLKEESVETVLSNILVHFYKLQRDSALYKAVKKRFDEYSQLPTMESVMNIPLMLTMCSHVWYEECEEVNVGKDRVAHSAQSSVGRKSSGRQSSYFVTSLYLKLLKVTITRTEKKHDDVRDYLCEKLKNPPAMKNTPPILSHFGRIIDFFEVFEPIGKLFFESLVKDTRLVFPKDELQRKLEPKILDHALKVGIFSLTQAPCSPHEERVSVDFHKSIQEFIAALFIACGDQDAFTLFCSHCNTVDNITELSNMVKFVFGLDPIVGCRLSEHVKDVINSSAGIMQYRERGFEFDARPRKEKELYKMQCEWYNEMKQSPSDTNNTGSTPTLHVTDVYLDRWSDLDDASMASRLVSMEDNSIVSVYLDGVDPSLQIIIQYLSGCKYLTTLYIRGITDTKDRELLTKMLPQLKQLQCVGYSGDQCPKVATAVVCAMQHLQALKCIELQNITLNRTVALPKKLQKVLLEDVQNAECILRSLPGCTKLTSLYISKLYTTKECELLASKLRQLKHLQFIRYEGSFDSDDWIDCEPAGHAAVVSALQQLKQLTHIKLSDIDLGDDGTLQVTSHMTKLQKVELDSVEMSARRWTEFFSSLRYATGLTHIKLYSISLKDDDALLVKHHMKELQNVELRNVEMSEKGWSEFFSSLQHATRLSHITLSDIDLGDDVLLLVTPHMTQLQKVELESVEMSCERFAEFFFSLLNVQHTVNVILEHANINEDTVKIIHNSPHFTVTTEERECIDMYNIDFHTVQQRTHIKLSDIDLSNLGDHYTLLSPDMSQLQMLELDRLRMPARKWTRFVASLQRATQLTHIKLSYIHLHSMDLAGTQLVTPRMTQLQKLTHLELGYINLGDDGTLLVTLHMAQLQKVELERVTMSDERWTEFFSSMQHATQLTHIKLSGIDLSNLGDDVTLLSPGMTRLQKVELIYVVMSPRRWSNFFSSLQHASKLTHITLSDIDLYSMDLSNLGYDNAIQLSRKKWPEFFSSLQHANRLTNVELSGIDLGDDSTLLVTPHMTQLQKVTLGVTMSPKRWAEFFSSLQHATQLTHIKLSNIDLSNLGDDVTLLPPQMLQLQTVELERVKMKRWADFFSSLQHLTQLKHLNLSKIRHGNGDDDDGSTYKGWKEFVLSLRSVQHTVLITLYGTDIDDDTLNTIQTHFTVIREKCTWYNNKKRIEFHTVR